MDDFKSIFVSKTFWGGLMAVAAGIFSFFGYELGSADQQAVIETGAAVAASLGGLIAIIGRVKASKLIK